VILALRVALVAGVLAVWQWAPQVPGITRWAPIFDPFFISSPARIAAKFWELTTTSGDTGAILKSGNLFVQLGATLEATVLGFVVGVGSGFLAGLVLSQARTAADIVHPYLVAMNALPRIALVPLITMVFGFGILAKVVLAWTIVFFIVFFNTFQGARSVDADLIHSARFLGGSDRQIMRTVIVPSALAWTFASLTPSISFALIGVVVGEFLGGESGGGLGYLIIQSLGTLNAADMMVALISLGVIGIVMALGIKQIEMRLLRWRPEYRGRA
jgi:NitT/TauT family transport system permease protein